MEMGILTTL